MKSILVLAALVLGSQNAQAYWSCTATCSGSENKILGMLHWNASAGEASDFQANCTQVLGGTIGTTSPSYCGAYYYCYSTKSSSMTVSGSGSDLIAARQMARASCQSGNFDDHTGSGCPYAYRGYFLNESSFQCSQ